MMGRRRFLSRCAALAAAPLLEEDMLDRWIGQMLMVGFRGTRLGERHHFRRALSDLHLGGTILFDYDVPSQRRARNIRSEEQVGRLTGQLQEASDGRLLVAIDQEGGRVSRLKPRDGFPESLSQAQLGRLDEESATRRQARRTGELLARLGLNVNFAPVLDLDLHPQNPIIGALGRSYSDNPNVAARHAGWVIEEFHRAGILAGVKHFPGHGSSREDSHLGLPDVTSHWQEIELAPFASLIRRGLPDLVMTAHLYNENWDAELPATLSPKVVEGMLRKRLGFGGVVVSDDLQMGAIAKRFTLEQTLEKAVGAGVDILAFANNAPQGYDPEIASKAHRILRRLVDAGRIPRSRIRESHRRIQSLKARLA